MNQDKFYSIADAARLLGVQEHRINYLHRTGKVAEPPHFAGRRMYRSSDLRRIAEAFGVDLKPDEGGDHE